MQKQIDLTGLYLTEDITIEQWQSDDYDRYEYTEDLPGFIDHVANYSDRATEQHKKEAAAFQTREEKEGFSAIAREVREWAQDDAQDDVYNEWLDCGDDRYIRPMMNALRYFPDFVSFDEADRFKCSGATCLVYDNERDAWAVGMSGGGMNLAPHLLDTFIQLRSCIPLELAWGIEDSYSAYVDNARHNENCKILSAAFDDYAQRCTIKAGRLMGEVPEK